MSVFVKSDMGGQEHLASQDLFLFLSFVSGDNLYTSAKQNNKVKVIPCEALLDNGRVW